eukprot:3882929-Pleurochrysis_carterae.AAC.3
MAFSWTAIVCMSYVSSRLGRRGASATFKKYMQHDQEKLIPLSRFRKLSAETCRSNQFAASTTTLHLHSTDENVGKGGRNRGLLEVCEDAG